MKLYEYDEALESMYRAADSASGVDAETGMVFDLSQLDAWEKARDEKIENALLYAEQLKADADDIEDYIKRLTARRNAKKNAAESIKAWLIARMQARGEKRFETKRVRATLKITAANKLMITDKAAIPAQYLHTEIAPDNTAIKEALKAGEHVPGAMLADSVNLAVK